MEGSCLDSEGWVWKWRRGLETCSPALPGGKPVHKVTGSTSAVGEVTLPFCIGGECHAPSHLGGGQEELSREKNVWQEEVFYMWHSEWLWMSGEDGKSLGRSRRAEQRGGTQQQVHMHACVCTHSTGLSLCYIVDYNSVKPSLYIELH